MLFVFVLAIADQAIKLVVEATMSLYTGIAITGWFNLIHTLNTGASFSFLASGGTWVRYSLIAIGSIATGTILAMLFRGINRRLEAIGLTGIAGGALGNVIDRLRQGAVTDYLDFHWQEWHWPAFNLADVFIVSGAGLLIAAGFWNPDHRSPIDASFE